MKQLSKSQLNNIAKVAVIVGTLLLMGAFIWSHSYKMSPAPDFTIMAE